MEWMAFVIATPLVVLIGFIMTFREIKSALSFTLALVGFLISIHGALFIAWGVGCYGLDSRWCI
jgi:hypothetical protein